ncbi:MAG: phage tail assembly protein [Pseudomonadales bacterium]|nr:phage tail assembly protein [Pseudomonadales bacterium]
MNIDDNGVATIAKNEEIDVKRLTDAMASVVTLELLIPLKTGGEERSELRFDEPTGAHVESMTKVQPHKSGEIAMRIIGECCGLGPDEMKQLRSRDVMRLSQVFRYFLPDSPSGMF